MKHMIVRCENITRKGKCGTMLFMADIAAPASKGNDCIRLICPNCGAKTSIKLAS